ncbi:MAG: molybdopterin molybdotransferase MoeA [Candidatus Bathyarchaeota archaeon]|nr:MAG: molybdopterin molybdotransferase MoeA [Candidatus Bathyarchaeota archaeon]
MRRKDLKRTFKLIPYEKALHRLEDAAHIEPLEIEEVAIEKSAGRVLAIDIVSMQNIPKKNLAVFDGYAIQSTDSMNASARNPVTLKIVGKTFPGETPHKLSSGQTVFTACGAPVPKASDAVIKTENVQLLEDEIQLRFSVEPGENIALAGEDVEKGSLILEKGCFLRPQDVGLLAGTGMKAIKVFKRPKVGILSVGDELIKLGEKNPDKIVNNYALIVSNLVSEFGGTPLLLGIAPDNLEQIKKKLSEALEKTDIVATIAGCSVGPKDLVPDAINALGEPGIVFHGVKLSPGKVMGAGIVKDKPIVMLPGHIVSTYAGFYLILAHLIAQNSGLGKKFPLSVVKARITRDVKAKPIASFLRVRLVNVDGEFEAEPVKGDSSVLTSLVRSNGYTIVPKGEGIKKGTAVEVVIYDRYEFTHIMRS